MVFVTDLGTHCAHTYPIHHLTRVTMVPAGGGRHTQTAAQRRRRGHVFLRTHTHINHEGGGGATLLPMLVHELLLSDGEGAEFIAQGIFIL